MSKKLIFLMLTAVLLCICLSGSADENSLKFDRSVDQLFEGETLQTQLVWKDSPAEGEITYASSDTGVATVDSEGLVTAVHKGKTVISVSVKTDKETFKAKLPLKVSRSVTELDIDTSRLSVYTGNEEEIAGLLAQDGSELPVLVLPVKKNAEIRASALPKDASNRKITMTSADENVLRVKGKTVSGRQAGQTILTIASEQNPEVAVQYRVLVLQPVSRISVSAPGKSVAVGATLALSAEVSPADASLTKIVWSSSDERIATVDENGVVTGVGRGNARIVAAAQDGSGSRASMNIKVTQGIQGITLDQTDVTVAAGKTVVLRAKVEPANADDRDVVWTSSDESVATVNRQGRVSGVALGECEIICTSKTTGTIEARAHVHVQQPVTSVAFGDAPAVYAGESAQLNWTVSPENASQQALTFTSGNPRVLTVDAQGAVTGVAPGETYVSAMTTDGTNRRARVKVTVYQHVQGVHMKRSTAYIDVGETAVTGAVLEPEKASNKNMTWEVADPSMVSVEKVKNQGNRIKIRGLAQGQTTVTGVTEDGGFPATLNVWVGDWDHALSIKEAHVAGADVYLTVRNDSPLTITSITAEVSVFDIDGKPVPANSKDDSNTFKVVFRKQLLPGEMTTEKDWKYVNFKLPESTTVAEYQVRIVQYQIDNDWVKTIRKKFQPLFKCPVHL